MLEKLLSIDDELRLAYYLKELYREFNLCTYYEESQEKIDDLIESFISSGIEEYYEFVGTLKAWKKEICNSFSFKVL